VWLETPTVGCDPHWAWISLPDMSSTIRDVVYEYGNLRAAAYYSIHGQAPWRTNCDDAFLLAVASSATS